MQPGYLPWLGFFELMWKCDIFVIYDIVQFDKNGWRNRNRIKTPDGPQWLTVPVKTRNVPSKLLLDIEIDDSQRWARKHITALRENYARSPWAKEYLPHLIEVLERPWQKLLELDLTLIKLLAHLLGIRRKVVCASELNIKIDDRVERLIAIIKCLGGSHFYEPAGGKNYLGEAEVNRFNKDGIFLEFQNYKHPQYHQLHGAFVPNLSTADLILNEGPKSLEILSNTT